MPEPGAGRPQPIPLPAWQHTHHGLVRPDTPWGVQSIEARRCTKGGQVYLVTASGSRTVGLSLKPADVDHLIARLEAIRQGRSRNPPPETAGQ